MISLSFAWPTNQWLTVNGTLTLVGDLTLVVNAGTWPNTGTARNAPLPSIDLELPNSMARCDATVILVPAGGQLVQKGNLNFVGGNGSYIRPPTFLTYHSIH